MKTFDVLAAGILVLGGLNWGLVGLLDLDLVATAAGQGTAAAQVLYATVGLAALYQVLALRAIQRRWNVLPATVRGGVR